MTVLDEARAISDAIAELHFDIYEPLTEHPEVVYTREQLEVLLDHELAGLVFAGPIRTPWDGTRALGPRSYSVHCESSVTPSEGTVRHLSTAGRYEACRNRFTEPILSKPTGRLELPTPSLRGIWPAGLDLAC